MRPGCVRVFGIITFLLGCIDAANAQPYRQLTADDFRGTPRHSTDVVAETACSISLQYDVHARDGRYQLTFHVALEVDRERSWIDRSRLTTRSRLEEVMKHEQGHYIISFLEQQELLRVFNRTRFDENYKEEVTAIFDRVHAKYEQLNRDYDDDTGNSRNVVQQASWDKYFQRKVEYLPPVSS